MKMTDADERAFAVLDAVSADIEQQGGRPDSMNVREHEQIKQAIEHLRARLAADQQKGGGEAFGWWCATGRGGFIRNDGTEDACEHCTPLYVTPQPSIPAPAQQDGKASGGEWRIVGVVTIGGIVWNDMPDPKTYLYAKNAPPHADQETQG